MSGRPTVRLLGAAVRVNRHDTAGEQLMEVSGIGLDGKPLLRPATRIVNLVKGEELPEDLADGELGRLVALDAVEFPSEAEDAEERPAVRRRARSRPAEAPGAEAETHDEHEAASSEDLERVAEGGA